MTQLDMKPAEFQWVLERWKLAFTRIYQRYNGFPSGFRSMVEAELWRDFHNSSALGGVTPSSSVVRRAITYCWRGHDTLGAKPAENPEATNPNWVSASKTMARKLAEHEATLAALRGPREMVTRFGDPKKSPAWWSAARGLLGR